MATVLERRIIAVSPDGAIRQQLEAALAPAADAFELYSALDAPGAGVGAAQAALCVLHLTGAVARAPGAIVLRLPGGCPVIAVLPEPDLAATVELMRSSDRVAGVLAADGLDPAQLSALAALALAEDIFGLEHVMPPGTQIHAATVGDHREKSQCMSDISELVEQAGAPRSYRAPIEQCVDEMLMNALYDAPVDARGAHVFAGVPAAERIKQRTDHTVAVQYAWDGRWLGVAVRDAFGTLDRQTVLRHLYKGLHAEQQVDRKVGGAGLGLYLMASSATAVHFHVLPGIATEVICLFDLEAPAPSLAQLGFLVQHDAAGRTASGPARRRFVGPRPRSRLVSALAGALIVVIGMAIGAGVLSRRAGCTGGTEAARDAPAPATLELDSQPAGATIEVDGVSMGSTPLALTQLAPGATVSIAFKRDGYRTATAQLQVPAAGERKRLFQALELSDELVRVRFVSNPPGAEVLRTGQAPTVDRTYTPAEVFVEAGKVQRFTLTMPGHVPLVIEPFTPERGARGLQKGGDLVEGATLHLEGPAGGKVTVGGAPHCAELALPADCTLAPGRYDVEYAGPGGAKATRSVTMGTEERTEKL
jgi:hypothetical protein